MQPVPESSARNNSECSIPSVSGSGARSISDQQVRSAVDIYCIFAQQATDRIIAVQREFASQTAFLDNTVPRIQTQWSSITVQQLEKYDSEVGQLRECGKKQHDEDAGFFEDLFARMQAATLLHAQARERLSAQMVHFATHPALRTHFFTSCKRDGINPNEIVAGVATRADIARLRRHVNLGTLSIVGGKVLAAAKSVVSYVRDIFWPTETSLEREEVVAISEQSRKELLALLDVMAARMEGEEDGSSLPLPAGVATSNGASSSSTAEDSGAPPIQESVAADSVLSPVPSVEGESLLGNGEVAASVLTVVEEKEAASEEPATEGPQSANGSGSSGEEFETATSFPLAKMPQAPAGGKPRKKKT